MSNDAIARPESRYGRARLTPAVRRGVVAALAALTVAAATVAAVVAYQRLATSDVSGKMAGYQLLDDDTVAVTISVTRSDPSHPVQCIVRARAKDGSETGRREVLVGPSEQQTVQVTAVLKSNKPPVMGDIYGCGSHVPEYLRAP